MKIALALLFLSVASLQAADETTAGASLIAGQKGDAEGLYQRAKRYSKGEGVLQDYAKAAQYMRQAAELGYAFAQNDLGSYYAKGLGVPQDFQEAAKWYRKAAEQGDSLAEFSMGRICSQGRGVPKDIQESLSWYKKAAAQNQPDALVALGDLYLDGTEGLKSEPGEALKYFQKAVEHGRVGALNSLGFLYENGLGVARNPERAADCYREAALKGDPRGQMNLGRAYLDGMGVKIDLIEAYKWFILAQRNGEPAVEKYLRDFDTSDALKPEEKNEARRRAEQFVRSQ